MTKAEFDAAIEQLLVQFQGSLTSGRRTTQHTIAKGGFAGDPHTWGLGADVVWDTPPPLTVGPFMDRVNTAGLRVLREQTHDHFQPHDFPAGPVTTYGGVTRPLPPHV